MQIRRLTRFSRNALWMGVPVVTLQGPAMYERISGGLLAGLGFGDWVTGTVEAYVARAVALAGDVAALARLRQEIRPRLLAATHFNPPDFTRDLEAAFRQMWRRWSLAQD